jgi:Na+/proline symporter
MLPFDWIVLLGSLGLIVAIGLIKTRKTSDLQGYLKDDNRAKWWTVCFSVMATQASAITFMSTPGQAYEEGMGFIQFYFGLPIAMVIIAAFFVPIYHRLKVFTAYEYLEHRFDLRTRQFTAFLFLVSRGLAAGITIYAPAIVLSKILYLDLKLMVVMMGGLVMIYTVSGGTRAVSYTQKWQLAIMIGGMLFAVGWLMNSIATSVPFEKALAAARDLGKLDLVNTSFNPADKYTLWSGLIGGTFLALGYFGTDQSQVARYLSGKSVREIRLGLLFNGLFKIPMQLMILFAGVLVFVFYMLNPAPVLFDEVELRKLRQSPFAVELSSLESHHAELYERQDWSSREAQLDSMYRSQVKDLVIKNNPSANTADTDYIFITFVTDNLPMGIVGLLIAVMFAAAMSSTSAELNALGGTAVVDFYKRSFMKGAPDKDYVTASKIATLISGIVAILFALVLSLFDNLIEAVNIIGSLFYGTILGVFLIAFFIRRIGGVAVFIGALTSLATILTLELLKQFDVISVAYLWNNVIGPAVVFLVAAVVQLLLDNRKSDELLPSES